MGAAYTPTLKLVSESEASPDIKKIYDEIKAFFNIDFVPQIFQTVAHSPERLRQVWELQKGWYQGKLGVDAKTSEIIGLAVAATRSCPYCINWHTTMLKSMGMSDAEIEGLVNLIGISNMLITYTTGTQLTPDMTPDIAGKISKSEAVNAEKVKSSI